MEKESIESGLSYLFAEETLYDLPDEENGNFNFEGQNKKRIVLLFNNPLTEKLTGTEKEIVIRMLAGLKSSLEDIAIMNLAVNGSITFKQIKKKFQINYLTVFDIAPPAIKLNIEAPLYQTIQLENCKLLFCESLIVIDKDKSTKLKFWEQFSQFFTVDK